MVGFKRKIAAGKPEEQVLTAEVEEGLCDKENAEFYMHLQELLALPLRIPNQEIMGDKFFAPKYNFVLDYGMQLKGLIQDGVKAENKSELQVKKDLFYVGCRMMNFAENLVIYEDMLPCTFADYSRSFRRKLRMYYAQVVIDSSGRDDTRADFNRHFRGYVQLVKNADKPLFFDKTVGKLVNVDVQRSIKSLDNWYFISSNQTADVMQIMLGKQDSR